MKPRTTSRFWICVTRQTSESAAASTSEISTIPLLTPATRKRYRPREVSPESRAPSFAASNTLKWHPHSNSGCEDVLPVMRANRAVRHEIDLALFVRTRHAQRAQVGLGSEQHAADEHATLLGTCRAKRSARRRASATKGAGCQGAATASRGILMGRERAIAHRRATGGLRPRRSRESEKRERASDKPPPPFKWPEGVPSPRVHVTAMFAMAMWARQQSAYVSGATLSGTGCALSLFLRERRTR